LAAAKLTPAEEAKRPNLLFVLADQWRASAFGFGSDAVVRTPNLDCLARQGANWRRAYAANPVCTPNRACILTGRYSHQTGMIQNNLQLPPDQVCWPETFRETGYATQYVGKWHLDGSPKPGYVARGWRRRGFDRFEGFNRGHVYHEPWGFDDRGGPLADLGLEMPDPYYEPTLQTDLAINFMRRQAKRPFACYLSWGPPHTPFRPPEAFKLYEPGEIALRSNVPQDHQDRARKELAGYYGLCESLDHEMGRLMAFLDENGLASNTLVIFTADHGELAGSHGKYRKGEPENESLQVPLLMRLPGVIPAESEPQTLINSVDLMPTLLSLCKLPASPTCAGRDLSGTLLADRQSRKVESIYCEGKVSNPAGAPANSNSSSQGPWRAIVTDRYKLSIRAGYETVEGLFDLQEDPLEMDNLAGMPDARGIQRDLLAELRDWGKRTDDSFPSTPRAARRKYPTPSA
jgi:arylsulfatase A-like enzyme